MRGRTTRWLLPWFCSVVLCAAAPASSADAAAETTPAPATTAELDWPTMRQRTFDEVWITVNESYFDPTFGGVDWAAVRTEFAARLPDVADKAALRLLLQQMLGELKRSHFGIVPREAAVFTPAERARIGTIGAEFTALADGVYVFRVHPDSPAARAGVHVGDAVTRVNETVLAELDARLTEYGMPPARRRHHLTWAVTTWTRAAVGTEFTLGLRAPDGTERSVQLATAPHPGEWSEPVGNFPAEPLEFESVREADGTGYLRLNVFAVPLMRPLRAFVRQLPADAGLILDLRANPGGLTAMAPGITGLLVSHDVSLGRMRLREGELGFPAYAQKHHFDGPVAVLIDGASASTSEILAAGLQGLGRARLFGETSAGAALPSAFKQLPTGDLFQYAIGDVQTIKGETIEGHGVVPDVPVASTPAQLAAGEDPVLAAARAWIAAEHAARETPPASAVATAPAASP